MRNELGKKKLDLTFAELRVLQDSGGELDVAHQKIIALCVVDTLHCLKRDFSNLPAAGVGEGHNACLGLEY